MINVNGAVDDDDDDDVDIDDVDSGGPCYPTCLLGHPDGLDYLKYC